MALGAVATTVLLSWIERSAITYLLPSISRTFSWTTADMGLNGGLLFSVFFVGYGLSLLFISGPAQQFGAFRSLYCIVIASAAVTIVTGVSASMLGRSSFPLIVGLRFALGLTEGAHIPMIATLVRGWFAHNERSKANAVFVNAALAANVFAPLAIIPVSNRVGWAPTLTLIGCLSLASIPLLWLTARTTRVEATRIVQGPRVFGSSRRVKRFRHLFLPLVFVGICGNVCAYAILSWLPSYLDQMVGDTTRESFAIAIAIPNAACAFGIAIFAWAGDRFGHKLIISGSGFFIFSCCTYLAATAGSLAGSVSWFAIGLIGLMAHAAQEIALIQRIARARETGRMLGWYSGVGMLAGGSLGTYGLGAVVAITGRYDLGILWLIPIAVLAAVTSLRLSVWLHY